MYEYHTAMDVPGDRTNTSVGWLVLLQPYIHRNMTESLLDYGTVLITSSATVVNKMNLSVQRPPPLRQLVQQQVMLGIPELYILLVVVLISSRCPFLISQSLEGCSRRY